MCVRGGGLYIQLIHFFFTNLNLHAYSTVDIIRSYSNLRRELAEKSKCNLCVFKVVMPANRLRVNQL